MKLIWYGYFIEILLLALSKPFITDFESVAFIAMVVHVIYTMIVLMSYKDKLKIVYLGAFLSRVILLIWDLYARHIFILPNSGLDSEMYYENAIQISNNLSLLNNMEGLRGGLYSQINGLLFYFIGSQRIVGQYINVLLGLSIIFIISRTLIMLNVNKNIRVAIILIISFFPNSIIMSAIFLREMFPTFLVSISLYFFIKWFKLGYFKYILLSLLTIGIASIFHSGIIGITLSYAFAILFYKRKENTFKFSVSTVSSFILIVIIFSLAFTVFDDLIFRKFSGVDNINDIYSAANSSMGGSMYLTNLTITNPVQLIIYGPIKALYFLIAPLPMDWRGIRDIVTFFSDSLLYLTVIIYFIKYKKKITERKSLIIILLIMIIGAAFIFGIGVGNAGTAMRHRQKLIPIFLILLGVMMDAKKRYVDDDKKRRTISETN